MPEPTEPSLTKPVASDAHCDPANGTHSESQSSVADCIVPANFVEIFPIPKNDSFATAAENEEEETEPDDYEDELSPSQRTLQEMTKRGQTPEEAGRLYLVYKQQCEAEEAERKADAATSERDEKDEEEGDEEDWDEFAEEEQPTVQPDQMGVNIGGHPANTADLVDMEDLIRRTGAIEEVRYVSPADGIINQFFRPFKLPSDLKYFYEPLFESLTLPACVEGFGTPRDLFDSISALLHKHVMLPRKDCSLLVYWAIATWFTDCLPFLPSVVISGPPSTADLLLRTLATICRRPVLLGELSPAIMRKLPINEITPTLLIREPQLSRYTLALLDVSNQPGYLFFSGKTFQELYCPKCIYVGEFFKDSQATSNSIRINLSETSVTPHHALPSKDKITSFQNRLLGYRLLNRNRVAARTFRFPGFRPEISLAAGVLAAAIVGDEELRRGIVEVLKERDEQSRVDRATGVNGVILRAVLFHCHQRDQQKFVREIAATANRLYAEDGESLKVSSEKVGHILKSLGLYSHRLGNAGRGLIFDKATQDDAHRLSHAYDVHVPESSCEHCHKLQQPQSEEVVQDV